MSSLNSSTSSTAHDIIYPTFSSSSVVNITKLNRNHYPIWKAQMLPYLKGQEVFVYVDGTIKPPSKTLFAANDTSTSSPQYAAWSKQDNLILSAINSSLIDEVLAQVYQASSSCSVWTALETCFAS